MVAGFSFSGTEIVELAFAASIMNAVILTPVLSCGNLGLYVASRML
nr:hypothetical protein [Clostridium sp. DMHC 10]